MHYLTFPGIMAVCWDWLKVLTLRSSSIDVVLVVLWRFLQPSEGYLAAWCIQLQWFTKLRDVVPNQSKKTIFIGDAAKEISPVRVESGLQPVLWPGFSLREKRVHLLPENQHRIDFFEGFALFVCYILRKLRREFFGNYFRFSGNY